MSYRTSVVGALYRLQARVGKRWPTVMTLGLWTALASTWLQTAQVAVAADFSHAQKIYVPPTRIERRVDFAALREKEAAGFSYTAPAASGVSHASSSGLVPPPPPLTPALAPAELPKVAVNRLTGVVPPPPPARSLAAPAPSGSAKQVASKAAHSVQPYLSQARTRAQQLVKSGNLDEASEVLRNALKGSPADTLVKNDLVNVTLDRARKYLGSNDLEAATKTAREALSINPASSSAANLLDELLRKSGIDPTDAAARLKLGDLLSSQGRDSAAAVEYRAALKLKPSAQAHLGLGNIAMRANKRKAAQKEYQLALEADPNSAAAHRQIGLLRQSLGDAVGANSDLSRALILDPQDTAAGKALVELWQRQVARAPEEASSHLGLARAYQLTGDLKSAQAEYRQVVRIDPNNPNLPAARQSFKLALTRQEADKAVKAATTLESQGALGHALQKVNEAVALSPSDPAIRFHQGQILEKLGQVPQARDAYLSVLKEDPNHVGAAQRLRELPMPLALAAPAQAGNIPALGAAPAPTEAPPLASLPSPTPDHLSNLSNFLVQLRNHSLGEKKRMEDVEDHTHKMLKSLHKTGSTTPEPGALPGPAATLPSAPSLSLPGALGGGIGAAGSSAAALGGGIGAAGSSAAALGGGIGAAGSSAGALGGGIAGGIGSSIGNAIAGGIASGASGTLPAITASNAISGGSAHILGTFKPAGIASAGLPSPAAPPGDLSLAHKRIADLERENQALKQQLQQAQLASQQARPAQSSMTPAAVSPATAGITAEGLPEAPPAVAPGQQAEIFPPLAPPIRPPTPAQNQVEQPLPLVPPRTPQPVPANSSGQASPLPGAVKLELEGLSPGLSDYRLKVVLRNNQDAELPLPAKPIAMMKSQGQAAKKLKVSFPGSVVPPHGEMHGIIKVPMKQLDPSVDLYIPNLLPAGESDRDLHLTAPISWR